MTTPTTILRRRKFALRGSFYLNFAIGLAVIAAVTGCASFEAQQKKEAELNAAEISMNRTQIFVSNSDISYPHRNLGKLEYTEPFSPDAIDTEKINNKLRAMAIDRFGDEVDAIENAHSDINDDGTKVTASGEALRITSPCSFCRHKTPDPPSGQANAQSPGTQP